MRVLVTGGTGVVGTATVTALVRKGHGVRLLARHAREGARQWPEGVEPRPGDVTDPRRVEGVADGCDLVLHLAAIVEEEPPHRTFELAAAVILRRSRRTWPRCRHPEAQPKDLAPPPSS